MEGLGLGLSVKGGGGGGGEVASYFVELNSGNDLKNDLCKKM